MAKLKYPKKPKLLKLKRHPKPSSTNDVLEKWLHHVKEVDIANRNKIKQWHDAKKHIDAERKKSEQLKKAVSGVGAIDYRNLWHKAPPRKKRHTTKVAGHHKKKTARKRKR